MSGIKNASFSSEKVLEVVSRALHDTRDKINARIDDVVSVSNADTETLRSELHGLTVALAKHIDSLASLRRESSDQVSLSAETLRSEIANILDLATNELSDVETRLGEKLVAQGEDENAYRENIADVLQSLSDQIDGAQVSVRRDMQPLQGKLKDHDDEIVKLKGHGDALSGQVSSLVKDVDDTSKKLEEVAYEFEQIDLDEWRGAVGRLDLRLSEHQTLAADGTLAIRQAADTALILSGRVSDDIIEEKGEREKVAAEVSTVKTQVAGLDDDLNGLASTICDDREHTQTKFSELDKTIAPLALRDDVRSLREETLDGFIKTEMSVKEVADATSEETGRISEVLTDLAERNARTQELVDDEVRRIRADTADLLTKKMSSVREWQPGPPYERLSFVQHRYGTWVASTATEKKPALGGPWVLLVNGVCDVRGAQVPNSTDFKVEIEYTSGKICTWEVPGFNLRSRGVWGKDKTYKRNDVVIRDGCSWRAECDEPQGDPRTSKDWSKVADGGARGRKGDKGDKGDMPAMPDVLRAYTDYLMRGDGTPTIRFRGRWQYQESYARGDIADVGGSLWICTGGNDGSVPPTGPSPGQPNDDWAVFYTAPQIQIPKSFVDAIAAIPEKMQWVSPYVPYSLLPENSVVNDSGWLMIANKETNDRAAPQSVGDPTYELGDSPVFTQEDYLGMCRTGHEYAFNTAGWFLRAEIWVPTVDPNVTYRALTINVTDPDNPIATVHPIPSLVAGQWNTIKVTEAFVPVGTTTLFLLEALNSASETTWEHEWTFEGVEATDAPPSTQWNRRNQQNEIRFDYTALDGDRTAELNAVVSGTIIRCSNVADSSQYFEYYVLGSTDLGTAMQFTVERLATGAGGNVPDGATTTVLATIPVAAATPYERTEGYWDDSLNQPTWAVVRGVEILGGVSVSPETNSAYGVRVEFQPGEASPDWDFMATSETGTVASGGGSGDLSVVDENGDQVAQQPQLQITGPGVAVVDGIVSGGDQDGNSAIIVTVDQLNGGTQQDMGEVAQDLGQVSGTMTIDISQGQSVVAELTGEVGTVNILNPTGHAATSFMLLLTTNGAQVTNWSAYVAGWFGDPPPYLYSGQHGFGFELIAGSWYGTYRGMISQ